MMATKTKQLPRQGNMMIVIVLLAFFAAWVLNLNYSGYTEDEAFVTRLIQNPAGDILQRLNTREPHPPLFYFSMRAWYLLTNSHNEFIMRFPAVLLGML